jgi:hypothetical protein
MQAYLAVSIRIPDAQADASVRMIVVDQVLATTAEPLHHAASPRGEWIWNRYGVCVLRFESTAALRSLSSIQSLRPWIPDELVR